MPANCAALIFIPTKRAKIYLLFHQTLGTEIIQTPARICMIQAHTFSTPPTTLYLTSHKTQADMAWWVWMVNIATVAAKSYFSRIVAVMTTYCCCALTARPKPYYKWINNSKISGKLRKKKHITAFGVVQCALLIASQNSLYLYYSWAVAPSDGSLVSYQVEHNKDTCVRLKDLFSHQASLPHFWVFYRPFIIQIKFM